MKNDKQSKKIFNVRIDDDLFNDMDYVREQLGINWSFTARELIQEKVNELKILADQKLSSKNKMGK